MIEKKIILKQGDRHVIGFLNREVRTNEYQGFLIADVREIIEANEPRLKVCVYLSANGYVSFSVYQSKDMKKWEKIFSKRYDSVLISEAGLRCIIIPLKNYRYLKITWSYLWSGIDKKFEVIYYPKGFSIHAIRYKERGIDILINSNDNYDITLELDIDGFKARKDITLKKGTNEYLVLYDETKIPSRTYTASIILKKDNYIIDKKELNIIKKDSKGIFTLFYEKIPWKSFRVLWNNKFVRFNLEKYGTCSYFEDNPVKIRVYLESGFNYILKFSVLEQASFCYRGNCLCVSYPNKYTKSFVNLCGQQDDIWDYVYHDKSEPEVRVKFGGRILYDTIMTGAYKKLGGYISDTYVKDVFTVKIEQISDYKYRWEIIDFNRYIGKGGRIALTNVDVRVTKDKFSLGGLIGTDVLNRKFDIKNAIDISIEAFARIGRSADVKCSSWPYSKVVFNMNIEKIY